MRSFAFARVSSERDRYLYSTHLAWWLAPIRFPHANSTCHLHPALVGTVGYTSSAQAWGKSEVLDQMTQNLNLLSEGRSSADKGVREGGVRIE